MYKKSVASRHFSKIRRSSREYCWCGGTLSKFRWHSDYGVCRECGTYVNRNPPIKDDLKELYSFETYWHVKQKASGLPVIEDRPIHDLEDGRVNFWLEMIDQYGPFSGQVIEVGCAPGILLNKLRNRGYNVLGVEPDVQTATWITNIMKVPVIACLFPDCELPQCDMFLSFDVLEHSIDPEAFMREASRLLKPGGIAIIQTTIDRYNYEPPFGPRFNDAFDPLAHIFIFTDDAITELAKRSEFNIISQSERIWLMGELVILKKGSGSNDSVE